MIVCAKTAEPTRMPFGLWVWMVQRNHKLHGGPDPPMGRGDFGVKEAPVVKYRDCRELCKNRLSDRLAGDAALCQITLTTCYGRPME